MDRIINPNWKFQLINTLLRGQFFVAPEQVEALAPIVISILNKEEWEKGFNPNLPGTDHSKIQIQAGTAVDGLSGNLDKASEGSTAIVPIKGSMLKYGTLCSYGMDEIAAAIMYAANHNNINSIVLDIDSGGGAVNAVAPVVQAIQYAQSKNKPVVASVDFACSAAYWVAAATNWIIADNEISSTIGSIGVMFSFYDVKGYYEKLGYKLHTIYAPESDHKNAPFEAALKGDYELLKTEELSPLAQTFQNEVKKYRGNKLKLDTPGLLNGRTFYAKEALKNGLIDEIGNRSRAIQHAQHLAVTWNFLKS